MTIDNEDQCNYYMDKTCSECGGSHKSYQCTINKEIDELVEDLKKAGVSVLAVGTAEDLLKLMENGEFSKKTKEEGK